MAWRDGGWKAPLFLAVASPVLAEVLSGNLPPLVFVPLLPLMLVAYGIPVLLIRDAWVRRGLGMPGLFALGLAYGFVNEALFAKTVFLDVGVPIDTFDGYAGSGLNWAWASFIVPWHALHSVLYPIAFAWWLFPARRSQPWLGRKTSIGLFALLLAVGAAIHLADAKDQVVDGTGLTLAIALALIAVFAVLAFLLPRKPTLLHDETARRPVAWAGALPALSLFALAAVSSSHLPTVAVVALSAAIFAAVAALLQVRRGFGAPSFLRFALVNELAFVALSVLFDVQRGAWDTLAAHVVMEAAFLRGLWRLRPMPPADAVAPG